MTYPDRESRPDHPFYLLAAVVFVMLVYLAFAVEASFRNKVCISAATVDSTGVTIFIPEVCN